MENALVLIPNIQLRTLYHELLLAENVEVYPVAKVENAVLAESLTNFSVLVFHTDDTDSGKVKSFLRIHKKIEKFSHTPIVLLTVDEYAYAKYLSSKDMVINIAKISPRDVVIKIKLIIIKSKNYISKS
jgi:hypothetical protein